MNTKFFQFIFKWFFQKLFILFYGSINEFRDFSLIDVKITELKNTTSDTKLTKYHIYEIEKGRIYTDTVENVAIIKDNTIIPNISYQQIYGELKTSKFNKVLKTGTPRIKKNFKGTVFSMVQGASGNNYFHFLIDIISRIKMCEEFYTLDDIDYFYVPNCLDWQLKIFRALGVRDEQIINSDKYRHIQADRILATDHPWYKRGKIQDEIMQIPSWSIFWLRKKFLGMAKKFDNNENIFIDRSESKFSHCQFQNNNELINFLKTKNFKSYKVSQLDFFEQIYLFNKAKIIIGPHGAAFANLVFCNLNCKVVEILPENHVNRGSLKITNILNINYQQITTPKLPYEKNKIGDMNFEIKKMNNIIENILS